MSLKMIFKNKWNVTKNGMSLNMEGHLKGNVTKNGMSLKKICQ